MFATVGASTPQGYIWNVGALAGATDLKTLQPLKGTSGTNDERLDPLALHASTPQGYIWNSLVAL